MSVRRQNVRTWTDGTRFTQTHDVWKLRQAHDIAASLMITALDSLGGIKAPDGMLWIKVFELGPPSGWTEVV